MNWTTPGLGLKQKIRDMEKESSRWMGQRMKLEAEVEELKNLAEELRMDIVEKNIRLNHLQKQNKELKSSSSQTKDEVIREFKSSNVLIDLLDEHYVLDDSHLPFLFTNALLSILLLTNLIPSVSHPCLGLHFGMYIFLILRLILGSFFSYSFYP